MFEYLDAVLFFVVVDYVHLQWGYRLRDNLMDELPVTLRDGLVPLFLGVVVVFSALESRLAPRFRPGTRR